jgi:hypothetical protein
MNKNLVKLAVIGIAAGTCISGQFAPLKITKDLTSANANAAEAEPSTDNSYAGDVGYNGPEGYSGKTHSNGHSSKSNSKNGSKENSNGSKQMKQDDYQSKNMEPKRKSAAARVLERG